MSQTKIEKVLVVEDERSLMRLYTTKLQMSGYTVESAEDGEEALKKVATFMPDLILLDIIIPKIDGFAVLEALKESKKTANIPVILLTNLGQDEDVEKGKKLGAKNYLIKSQFTPSEIVAKMEKTLQ